ncbi:uncharacterized protein LOC128738913 [Sabethes cyaneus]|uniref:uncharacterized protein LOC128738913 n=1 Tax=Sabethes cyaneus TaxID=53552 RepID=UPI00237E99EF|nr:uncharacterized protein LOC128738913 [Sabethes cyaneus]
MSTDEFIYSVINSDNVAQFDLNLIANTLANVDSLIRQIKSQQVENENLKEKISSLRTTALQIKQIYQDEKDKNKITVNREKDYIRQLQILESRALAAENGQVNAELREKETVAELDRQLQNSKHRYDSLACDMVKNCSLLWENSLLPSDQQMRFRDVKSHVQGLIQCGKEIPEDVVASLNRKKGSRKRRKSESETRDQATITVAPSCVSVGVNTARELPCQATASTSTHDLMNNSLLETGKKPRAPLVDKSTMYCSSTITRSTCTSAFIKKVDVGVNFPEVVPKSINDILKECVVELPSLLTPILDDVLVHKESVHTQTEPLSTEISQPKIQKVHCGTNTNLRNIRRRIDYVRKMENVSVSSHLLSSIKKEESVSPTASILNLPDAFHQSEDHPGVNPQLSHLWALLGETMFRLLGSGRLFDSQCYNTINERMTMINSLIDSDTVRGKEMMNKVFAAASAAIISGEKQCGAGKGVVGRHQENPEESVYANHEKNMSAYEEGSVLMQERQEGDEESQNNIQPETCLENDINTSEIIPTPEFSTVKNVVAVIETPEFCATEVSIPSENSVSVESEKTNESSVIAPEATLSSTVNEPVLESSSLSVEDTTPVLMEQNVDPGSIDVGRVDASALEENDEIANQLRLMEEGNVSSNEVLPNIVNYAALLETSQKKILHVVRDEDSLSSSTEDEHDQMLIIECSPIRSLPRPSCTTVGNNGTLISPIKVKETNELVKDQFKTPTSPAISKRKLRERLEGTPPKRGRLSPTTEALLEDDWDRKLLCIKNYFSYPSSLIPIEDCQSSDVDENEADDKKKTLSGVRESCMRPGTVELIHSDDDTEQDLKPAANLLHLMQTQVDATITTANLPSSPKSPMEDSASGSQWNDFKVPLSIETGSNETPTFNTDSPESPLLEDSPMSPVPEIETDTLFSCDDSPMSPPIDSRMSIYNEIVEPQIIPLEHVYASHFARKQGSTPIAKTIALYSKNRRAQVLRQFPSEAALIQNVCQIIKNYISDDWTIDTLKQRSEELLGLTKDSRIISLAMIDSVISYGDMPVDVQCSPPAPPLPKVVQQLVLLAKTLNESIFNLDRVMLQEIDRKVFTLKSDKEKLEELIAVTHLYIGICDCNRLYGCTARLYIFKSLYYFNFKGLPLLYHVLKAFPHALPKKSSMHYDNSDAMVSTLRTILMNLNYKERSSDLNAHMFKKTELHKLLKFFYGYQQGSPTYEELIVNLVEKIKANKLRNVDYCLILVAKRKGYEWSKKHIVEKYLYPLLDDYLKRLDADGKLNEQVVCLIFTISSILKTSPNGQDITGFMQNLGRIVQMTNGNPMVQESAVAALLRMSRYGFADIYEWLCKWRPNYAVSVRTKLMLATFVHRKEQRFWQRLCQKTIV